MTQRVSQEWSSESNAQRAVFLWSGASCSSLSLTRQNNTFKKDSRGHRRRIIIWSDAPLKIPDTHKPDKEKANRSASFTSSLKKGGGVIYPKGRNKNRSRSPSPDNTNKKISSNESECVCNTDTERCDAPSAGIQLVFSRLPPSCEAVLDVSVQYLHSWTNNRTKSYE